MPHTSYAGQGLLACATPPANPTVEPEFRRLMPKDANVLFTRSRGYGSPRERLTAYFDHMEAAISSFGGLRADAFGFACTASSYLLDPEAERQRCRTLERRFQLPIRTAAGAVAEVLQRVNGKHLLVASPYPDWIHSACLDHWERLGFEVVAQCAPCIDMADPHAIYELDPRTMGRAFFRAFRGLRADALLLSGTGLPTLALRRELRSTLGLPVLSANPCLAWSLLKAAGKAPRAAGVLLDDLLSPSG